MNLKKLIDKQKEIIKKAGDVVESHREPEFTEEEQEALDGFKKAITLKLEVLDYEGILPYQEYKEMKEKAESNFLEALHKLAEAGKMRDQRM